MKKVEFKILTKFSNILMRHGKSSKSSKIVNQTIKELSKLNPYKDPIKILLESLDKLAIPIKLIKLPRKYVKRQIKNVGSTKKIILYKPLYFLKDGHRKGISLAIHMLFKGALIHKKRMSPQESSLAKIFAKELLMINNFIHGFLNHKTTRNLKDFNNLTSNRINLLKLLTKKKQFNINKSKIFNKYLKLIYFENITKKLLKNLKNTESFDNLLYFLVLNKDLHKFSKIWYCLKQQSFLDSKKSLVINQKQIQSLIYFFKETKRPRIFSGTLFIYFRLLGYVNDKRRRIIYRW